jgi:hypothetical protein
MIPNKSEASLKNGNWLIYNDGMNTIQVWGSNFNGKEKVFLNNELVSEGRNRIKKQSTHPFQDNNGNQYEVKFETKSLSKGVMECLIIKENKILKVFQTNYIKGKSSVFRILNPILAGALFVYSTTTDLPLSMILILYMVLIALFVYQFKTRDPGKIIIKE